MLFILVIKAYTIINFLTSHYLNELSIITMLSTDINTQWIIQKAFDFKLVNLHIFSTKYIFQFNN